MAERCSCERSAPAGPSTHRGVVHLATCKHSQLERTTRPFEPPPKVRKIVGTKRLVRIEPDNSDG